MENIIDFRIGLRTKEDLASWLNPDAKLQAYIKMYRMQDRLTEMPTHRLVQYMNECGVSKAIVCGGSKESNKRLFKIKKSEEGKKLCFIAGVTPELEIYQNIAEIEQCREAGFLGVSFNSPLWGIKANDKKLFPLYSYCEQHELTAIVHSGVHFRLKTPVGISQPEYIDEIAIYFPKLKIVMSHAGNGFGDMPLTVAQRHDNVYLEFSSLMPKYIPSNTLSAINSYLKEKALFGSNYPSIEFSRAIKAWEGVIKPENHELFFRKNANQCLFEKPK